MAEVVALLASVAGVSTAGLQIAKLLYSSIQHVKNMQDDIRNVAREVEALSSVFEEIGTALQVGQDDMESASSLRISRRAIVTISELVKDSQDLHGKIGITIFHQSERGRVGIVQPSSCS